MRDHIKSKSPALDVTTHNVPRLPTIKEVTEDTQDSSVRQTPSNEPSQAVPSHSLQQPKETKSFSQSQSGLLPLSTTAISETSETLQGSHSLLSPTKRPPSSPPRPSTSRMVGTSPPKILRLQTAPQSGTPSSMSSRQSEVTKVHHTREAKTGAKRKAWKTERAEDSSVMDYELDPTEKKLDPKKSFSKSSSGKSKSSSKR